MSLLREIIAKFQVGFDTKELERGSKSIEETIEHAKHLATTLGAGLLLGEVKEFIVGLTEQAHALGQQAEAFGLSTEEMQQWHGAAEIAGASTEALDTGFKIMAKNVGEGTGPAVQALQKLGVHVKDASGKVRPLGDLFEDAGEAIGTLENAGERAAIGTQVFGRQFIKLLPLISKGRDGMAKLRKEVMDLGGGFTDEFVEKSAEVQSGLKRLNILFTSIKVTIASALLPAVIGLTGGMIRFGKPLLEILKNSQVLKTALIALGTLGLMWLSTLIGPLEVAFASLAGTILTTVLPLLILEDFLTFLSGGDSLIGRAIDKAFGAGSADKVLAWIGGIKKELFGFIDDVFNHPLRLQADMEQAEKQFGKGGVWDDLLNTAVVSFLGFTSILTGGWKNFGDKVSAIWDGIGLAFRIAWSEIKFFGLGVAAALSDKFDDMFNAVLRKARAVLLLLPGTDDAIKRIDSEVINNGQASKDVEALYQKERAGLAGEGYAIGQRLNAAPPGAQVQTNTTVHVTVPPGTPEETASRVGAAAAAGANKGANTPRGTFAVLNPGKG